MEQIAKQAREFASGEYLEYLFDGARATQAQREKVLTNMSRYTGLSKTFIDALDLRVPLGPFSTELLRDQHLMTSRLDSRFAGYQIDAGANNTSFDYSNSNIENCFLTAFEAYVRNELNYKNDNLYYVSGNAPPWSGEYNTVVNLENAFAKNPHMQLFVGFGYYDFACPFYPGGMDPRPHEGVGRNQEEQHFARDTMRRVTWSTSTGLRPPNTTPIWRSSCRRRCPNNTPTSTGLNYQVMRAVYCNTRAPCAELRRLMMPSVLGVPIPG